MSWDGKVRGSSLGHRIFIYILKFFGLGVGYFLLHFVVIYFYIFFRKSFKSLYFYYSKVLKYDRFNTYISIYKNMYRFGQNMIDRFVILSGGMHHYKDDHNEGGTYLYEANDMGKGLIMISGHVGNFEIGSQLLKRIENKINVLMYVAENEEIKQVYEDAEKKKTFEVIPIKDDLSHVIKVRNALANNEFICLHGDRYMQGADVIEKEFMGFKTYFPKGPFIIASRFGAPVTFAFVVNKGGRFYKFTATPPKIYNRDLEGALDDYIKEFEKVVNENPHEWFNHYDFWNQKLY
jgi:predicted LPLAT superfamily acyltransferase